MKREKSLHFYRNLHRLGMAVGALTAVLPLIFWRWIPDKISGHYGVDGRTDRIGDKSELFLLIVVVLFLMGMMAIVVYYLRTSAESANTKEEQKTIARGEYRMVVWMNLFIQCIFLYIMVCTMCGWNLGKFFLPISLAATFAPIVYYLIRRPKCRSKEEKRQMRQTYKQIEKTEEGTVYRTAIDWCLGLILYGTIGLELYVLIRRCVAIGKIDWVVLVSNLLVMGLILPLSFIRYTLYSDHILVDTVVFGKERIPYNGIYAMKKTNNPLSSAAMSLKRIEIHYEIRGQHKSVMISPVRRDEFMQNVEAKRNQWKGKTDESISCSRYAE